MQKKNYPAVVVAAVAAFVASAAWYTAFGGALMRLQGVVQATVADTATPVWTMLFVVAQSLIVASLLSYFAARLGIVGLGSAVRLGALVWIFPAMILLGSVVHENVPVLVAAIHAGDWLVKLLLIALIVVALRRGRRGTEPERPPNPQPAAVGDASQTLRAG